MRILAYRSAGGDRAGVRAEAGILDAGALLGMEPLGVRELLAAAGSTTSPGRDPTGGARGAEAQRLHPRRRRRSG
ncbi:MAG TPA: hypothetical protein VHH72_02855 [Solirubrobacterales bacterium]|nr:hypothetical protein [Solirubrobacterales bacterium]